MGEGQVGGFEEVFFAPGALPLGRRSGVSPPQTVYWCLTLSMHAIESIDGCDPIRVKDLSVV